MGADRMRVVLDTEGRVANIGEWDTEASGPLPEGFRYSDEDIVFNGAGTAVLASDYRSLREHSYPSIGDQLDALFRAGLFPPDMAEKLQAVKDMYPKEEYE